MEALRSCCFTCDAPVGGNDQPTTARAEKSTCEAAHLIGKRGSVGTHNRVDERACLQEQEGGHGLDVEAVTQLRNSVGIDLPVGKQHAVTHMGVDWSGKVASMPGQK